MTDPTLRCRFCPHDEDDHERNADGDGGHCDGVTLAPDTGDAPPFGSTWLADAAGPPPTDAPPVSLLAAGCPCPGFSPADDAS